MNYLFVEDVFGLYKNGDFYELHYFFDNNGKQDAIVKYKKDVKEFLQLKKEFKDSDIFNWMVYRDLMSDYLKSVFYESTLQLDKSVGEI